MIRTNLAVGTRYKGVPRTLHFPFDQEFLYYRRLFYSYAVLRYHRSTVEYSCASSVKSYSPSILLSRLSGESGMESPSDVRLYECSDLMGTVPSAASVMRRSWRITCGFTSKIVAVHSRSGSVAILKASEMA